MPFPAVDLTRVKTYPLVQRENRVALENLIHPHTPLRPFDNPELGEVAARIAAARRAARPVIFMFGAHLVKRGLAPILIDLLERGVVTHLASNGAATIHDFEIALQGNTSEDVVKSLEDGSFGMAEETGALMNAAIRRGANDGLGLGESLGRLIDSDPRFTYRAHSLLHTAYRLGIPYTVHVALGTDIIHQHPAADFAATGWASGQDFKIFTQAVCSLEGGVFCNFGSAVIGPEVFLKAVSIARNLGNPLKVFTTANFDLIQLENYRAPLGDEHPEYYYRPRKNIVNRPVMLGGRGFHISADHLVTLPNLRQLVVEQLPARAPLDQRLPAPASEASFAAAHPQAARVLEAALLASPALLPARESILRAYRALLRCFQTGGTLFLAGNGGSMSDAIHISGELDKAYKLPRPIPAAHAARLASLPGGTELTAALQVGLRSVVLGNNPALASAVENDFAAPYLGFAQELYALAHPGDVFLGISTSGNAKNVLYAVSTARALHLTSIGLTGQTGGRLAREADIPICAPASDTPLVQGWHLSIYHCLCEMLEAAVFTPEVRS